MPTSLDTDAAVVSRGSHEFLYAPAGLVFDTVVFGHRSCQNALLDGNKRLAWPACRTTAHLEPPRALIEHAQRLAVTRPPGGLRSPSSADSANTSQPNLSSVTSPCAWLRAAVFMFLSDSAHRCASWPIREFHGYRSSGQFGSRDRQTSQEAT